MWRTRFPRAAASVLSWGHGHQRPSGGPLGSSTTAQAIIQKHGLKSSQHARFSRTNDPDDVTWLFPAGASQERMHTASKFAIFNVTTTLTLNSAQPLPASVFEETLHHLQRKAPSLRTGLRFRGQQLWVCELRTPPLDFKVVTCDLEEEVNSVQNKYYDSSNGPVWCARLCHCEDSELCPLPEVKLTCPHQYHLIFGFYHGANDGISATAIIAEAIKILNGVLRGVSIDDRQLGTLSNPAPLRKIEKSLKTELERDPQRLNMLLKQFKETKFSSLLADAFGHQAVSQPSTQAVHCILEGSVMGRFGEKCLAAGVTLNSGFKCVIDQALVELVREAGLERDLYSVTCRYAFSERRYLEEKSSLGCLFGAMSHTTAGTVWDRQEFWPYAQVVHGQLREMIESKRVYQERVLRQVAFPKDFSYESYFQKPPPITSDYFLSSVNVHGIMDGKDSHLQVTGLTCVINIHNTEYSNFHFIGKFRENMLHTLMYSTNHLTREVAQSFQSKVKTVLKSLAA